MYVLGIYALLGIVLLAAIIRKREIPQKIQIAVYITVMLFFVLRFPLGNDIAVYKWLFDSSTGNLLEAASFHISRNLIFTEFAWLCKVLFHDYRWFILTLNIVTSLLITGVIRRHGKHWLFGVLLFIGTGMLEVYYTSGLRQSLCMAILLVAICDFLPKKKIVLFELLCAAAVLCHDIGVAAIPLPLLLLVVPKFKEHPKKTIIVMSAVTAVLCLINFTLIPVLAWKISGGYMVPPWLHGIIYFLDTDPSIMGIGMEAVFGIGLTLILMNTDLSRLKDEEILFVLVLYFSIFLYLAFANYSLMSRISDALQLCQIVVLPITLEHVKQKKKAIVFLAVLFLNGFLLYSDLNAKCRGLSGQVQENVMIADYPYISVFDEESIDRYLNQKIWQ